MWLKLYRTVAVTLILILALALALTTLLTLRLTEEVAAFKLPTKLILFDA